MSEQHYDHNHNASFPSALQTIHHNLQTEHANATKEVITTHDDSHFLAVRYALRNEFDTTQFRTSLASLLGTHNDIFTLIQIVGDSGSAFLPGAVEKISEVVREYLNSTSVLEYGYTASHRDVNWIVNDIISRDLDLAKRTVASLVYESAVAVGEWGCEATGHVKTFALVYDEGRETGFGDDVFLSDGLMAESYGDVMICVEGGVQSLEQVCGILRRGVKVVAVTGALREDDSATKFSAARVLRFCADAVRDGRDVKRIGVDLMNDLRGRGVFDGKPNMYGRVESCIGQILQDTERLEGIRVVVVD